MKIIWGFLGLIILIVIASLFFGMNKISGESMEPTLKNQTTVLTWDYLWGRQSPKRGDIIIYKKASSESNYVGRVVALPQESVRLNNGNFYIDNNLQRYKVEEGYLSKEAKTYANTEDGNSPDWMRIGEFSYLVLPDNRNRRFNLEDQLVNKNNIESVVIMPL